MFMTIKPSCATCRFFERFTEESTAAYKRLGDASDTAGDDEPGVPILATDHGDELLEYGRCLRNPPQLFCETLNGEWPVVHENRVCGEYRRSDGHSYG